MIDDAIMKKPEIAKKFCLFLIIMFNCVNLKLFVVLSSGCHR